MEDDTPFPSIEIFEVLTSTLDSIHQAAAEGAPEWTTHIAREQTRGRGQQARPWWSPSGAGLWMSTLLRPSTPRRTWGGIALVAGAATRSALESLGVKAVELRWPNDLYVDSRKLGGILAESRSLSTGAWISLGIGINVDLESGELRKELRPLPRHPLPLQGPLLLPPSGQSAAAETGKQHNSRRAVHGYRSGADDDDGPDDDGQG